MVRKKVAIVVMDGASLMDFAGPAEVFHHAGKLRGIYDVTFASPLAAPVSAFWGIDIKFGRLTDLGNDIDTLLIIGHAITGSDEIYDWLSLVHKNIRRIGFIKADITLLEKSGMSVDFNFFRSRDGQQFTSGGVSSGIDLALAMVEEDCGRAVAAEIARAPLSVDSVYG